MTRERQQESGAPELWPFGVLGPRRGTQKTGVRKRGATLQQEEILSVIRRGAGAERAREETEELAEGHPQFLELGTGVAIVFASGKAPNDFAKVADARAFLS